MRSLFDIVLFVGRKVLKKEFKLPFSDFQTENQFILGSMKQNCLCRKGAVLTFWSSLFYIFVATFIGALKTFVDTPIFNGRYAVLEILC